MNIKLVIFICLLVTLLMVSANAARGGGASRGGHAAGHAAGHVVGRAAGHGTGANGGTKRARTDPIHVPGDNHGQVKKPILSSVSRPVQANSWIITYK